MSQPTFTATAKGILYATCHDGDHDLRERIEAALQQVSREALEQAAAICLSVGPRSQLCQEAAEKIKRLA